MTENKKCQQNIQTLKIKFSEWQYGYWSIYDIGRFCSKSYVLNFLFRDKFKRNYQEMIWTHLQIDAVLVMGENLILKHEFEKQKRPKRFILLKSFLKQII